MQRSTNFKQNVYLVAEKWEKIIYCSSAEYNFYLYLLMIVHF